MRGVARCRMQLVRDLKIANRASVRLVLIRLILKAVSIVNWSRHMMPRMRMHEWVDQGHPHGDMQHHQQRKQIEKLDDFYSIKHGILP